ncbi:FeoA family protein [Massilia glaciei]|uniref:Ferrous iron transport protein A n=1 Tax=Massilia glaciei TaxID=1524097 RepID=A0A2U2HHC0_9BURK|nr:FeoA domain-containing protein [Massilia glaciei]PWF45041.1 ferrous iron transport protein A [Massilia glaciei]
MTQAPTPITLDCLATGGSGTVVRLAASAREPGADADAHVAHVAHVDHVDLSRRLMELGFVPGERIRMLKRGMPGGDPLAVKVGESTFALRRFEAALITIDPE